MSEKKRQKKDGEDRNKRNRRMRAVTSDLDEKVSGRATGREGSVKRHHKIDSIRQGYGDDT